MRVLFPKGGQKKFINEMLSFISIKDAAKLCNLSERTIRDWRREKYSANNDAIMRLCEKTKITFPLKVELKEDYWYTATGSNAGALAVLKKYGRIGGDAEYAKKKWYEWWEREGKFKSKIVKKCKPINKPKFSEELAEFVGITLGDGGITDRQLTITLHCVDDKEYGKFVTNLMEKLFKVHVSIFYDIKNTVNRYSISRTKLIRFCTEKLGLKIGNKIKQQVDIPQWIKRNKLYAIACTRGLIDTDGCIFSHNYKVHGKIYGYKKLAFTSYSKPLRESVFNILRNNGLNPRLAQDRDVRLDSVEDMKKYFQLIGSHNPKHLNKWEK